MNEDMEPITRDEIREWNKPRWYGCVMFHRLARTRWQRLRRRPPTICPHIFQANVPLSEAVSKAQALSEEMPCIVVLFDLQAGTVVDRWITDPEAKNVTVESFQRDLGGLMGEIHDA